jgi:hypothetical protein
MAALQLARSVDDAQASAPRREAWPSRRRAETESRAASAAKIGEARGRPNTWPIRFPPSREARGRGTAKRWRGRPPVRRWQALPRLLRRSKYSLQENDFCVRHESSAACALARHDRSPRTARGHPPPPPPPAVPLPRASRGGGTSRCLPLPAHPDGVVGQRLRIFHANVPKR